ncbi:MAG: single-stranded-DNA-specific exonuclease RecJ [Clostridia bacterium]|nr:single-stranded-DNA-specific exonuclease RecJ [Clostridia bacterium]
MDKVKAFSAELGVSPLFADILLSRGIETANAAKTFLHPSADDLTDPFSLAGMKEVVARIREAIAGKEKIVVYGDYDCDGIMATSILSGYLSSIGADVEYYIPNRFENGYGLNVEALEEIAETYFPDLIITVDCGTSSVKEAEYLSEDLAIDLIVTDHHTLPDVLPNAILLNPKLTPESPAADLCGAGVAFKIVQALGGLDDAMKYVDFAAIATIADVVPLTRENRTIAYLGLKKINSRASLNKGLRMLIESCDFKSELTATDVSFTLAPRINAIGRISDAKEVVRLFISDEYIELEGLVEKLKVQNELRRSLEAQELKEAYDLLKDVDLATHKLIFLYNESWNIGVIGLIAGKISKRFHRPTVILGGEDILKGSARSPEGIDIYKILKSAESVLEGFGGHKAAAGLSVKPENALEARRLMDAYIDETYPNSAFEEKAEASYEIASEEITVAFADELNLLEPTGEGNPKPTFRISSASCALSPMSNPAHAKAALNKSAELVAFGVPYLSEGVSAGVRYDLIAKCGKNVYKNKETVQMKVCSVVPTGYEIGSDLYAYNRYLRSNLYAEAPCEFTPISFKEAKDAFYDDDFCTLFIAFSSATVSSFQNSLGEKKLPVSYAQPHGEPANALVIAPDFDLCAYRRVVLLDTPLTKGYISHLSKISNAEIYVVTDNYPFKQIFASIDFSRDSLFVAYGAIRRFVFSGNAAASPIELASKTASSAAAFLAKFYALYESGSLKIGQGFALSPQEFREPSDSLLYRRICALKSKNENV